MAINLFIRLKTTYNDFEALAQHYKETYVFEATGSEAYESIQNYRLRHFLTANCPNSTVMANSGLIVYDGTGILPLTGSYNDWTTPNRPPRFDNSNNQFNTELIMRFDVNRTFADLRNSQVNNAEAWITAPYSNDNGAFATKDVERAFSFLGYSNDHDYVKNPLNIVLEHKVAGGSVSRIYTDPQTLASSGLPECDDTGKLYTVETVVVETQSPHGLRVGDSVTLYSRSVSHAVYGDSSHGRMFGKSAGERYLGDFIVTGVPNQNTFTYETYHNPMRINSSNHPEYYNYNWNDLVWERWVIHEYAERVNVGTSGSSVVFTFTETAPDTIISSFHHNFAVGDFVTFKYNTSDTVSMVVTDVSNRGSITAVPADGETFPSGVTLGTLVYTPRLPSADVATNLLHDDIAPQAPKNHIKESAIIYACQDTYYAEGWDSDGGRYAVNGYSNELHLRKDIKIPIVKFPVPTYKGDATDDPNLVAKVFIFATGAGGTSNNQIYLMGFNTDNWHERNNNDEIKGMHNTPWSDNPVGQISQYFYGNPARLFTGRYIKFDVDREYVIDMLKGEPGITKTIFLNSRDQSSEDIKFSSRQADDNWPYIAITSGVFLGKNPRIDIENTYMYLVCDSIEKSTYGGGPAYVATVSDKLFDSSHPPMYVRSWDANKPFFAQGDIIEIMNTDHYNTISAEVVGVEYSEHKVYFTYSGEEPSVGTGVKECGIIRNRSRMISSYDGTDIENNTNYLSVNGPVNYGKYGYNDGKVEFDVIHADTSNDSTLSVVYNDGYDSSNEISPVILTDVEIIAEENGHDRPADRFLHVGPDNGVVLKGFNLKDLSQNATAVLGHSRWENGIETGTAVTLLKDNEHPDERYFYYGDAFDLQRTLPVYGVRNVNGVTEFKVLFEGYTFVRGDIVAPVVTGLYLDSSHTTPSGLKYGSNYYIESLTDDGVYTWIKLSSSYIERGARTYSDVPTYVSLSSSDVAYINSIIPSEALDSQNAPLVLYSTITSLIVQDGEVDTNKYYNRLYLQIDEEPPICHVSNEEPLAGQLFYLYISDLNDIIKVGDISMANVEHLLGDNNDFRFIKVPITLTESATLDIYDAAGNYTSITLDVIPLDSDIRLDITGISSDVESGVHTLHFRVSDSDYTLLSRTVTKIKGGTGIYTSFGTIPEEKISNITRIDDGGYFTFDLVLTKSDLFQHSDALEVWAGDTNENDAHKNDMWMEPIVFLKNQTCVETGSVLEYLGVNLKIDEKTLELRGPNYRDFSIEDIASNSTISIKVLTQQKGKKQFGVKWVGVNVKPAFDKYLNTVTVTGMPTIDIQPDSRKFVKWKKGVEWTEPEVSDIIAKDWEGADISDTVTSTIDNPNWDDAGIHTITYTATDSCGRVTEPVTRTILVTECDIPIRLVKSTNDVDCSTTYDTYEDIEIMIAPESTVRFNQNFMNNIVEYQLPGSDEWITAVILTGTPDRKRLTIKNPGVIASGIKLIVDVGSDNTDVEACSVSDPVCFNIVSKQEQDKPLDVDGKASIVRKNSKRSRFEDLNFEPIYNKDLSYSSFSITADENSLMQNVYSILLTNLGERLYDDEFGSTLEESVFEIIGDLNGESKLLNQCVSLINKYEPRVVVVEDKSYISISDDNTVVIVLYIKVPRGIARKIELTFRKDA